VARRESKCPFTLIELLVVVSIIAILAALLLPALRGARERAAVVECMSRQKQIVIAATVYADDHESQLPNTDGSWISRHKNGPYTAQGIGTLIRNEYLPLSRQGVSLAFCPSARETWNWRQPPHMYNELTTQFGSNNWSQSTLCGKFCTFVGYNSEAYPTQADLYLGRGTQEASVISPILTSDLVFDSNTLLDPRQGHRGKGIVVCFYNGAARFQDYQPIYMIQSFGGLYNTINPYGNFWLWAKAEYGQ